MRILTHKQFEDVKSSLALSSVGEQMKVNRITKDRQTLKRVDMSENYNDYVTLFSLQRAGEEVEEMLNNLQKEVEIVSKVLRDIKKQYE